MSHLETTFAEEIEPPSAGGERRAAWGVPAALAPNEKLLRWVGRVATEPAYDCVLLGPSGAGKTSWLMALGGAAAAEADVRVVPGRPLADLVAEPGPAPPVTADPAAVDFQVRCAPVAPDLAVPPAAPAGESAIEVAVLDTPGRGVFGGDPPGLLAGALTARCLAAAADATCLVLCIDGEDPRADIWRAAVPQLVSRLAGATGALVPRLASHERDPEAWRELPPELRPERRLRCSRLLVLVTKIDVLCEQGAGRLSAGVRRSPFGLALDERRGSPAVTAFDVARQLDPTGTATALFGGDVLGQLRNALAPGAQLAVGLTSARGMAHAATGAARPWGVREALHFLVSGRAEHPVESVPAVSDSDLDPWIEVSSWMRMEVR